MIVDSKGNPVTMFRIGFIQSCPSPCPRPSIIEPSNVDAVSSQCVESQYWPLMEGKK